jgi:uncharacterized protein YndB with AHSA1/START domain
MLVAVLVVLVTVCVALLAFARTRPDSYSLQRVMSINASPERIFSLIIDFRHWPRWSPFEALDPTMKRAYSGAVSGKGAIYEWDGNSRAGKGRMEITETSPPSRATVKVDFLKPFDAHNLNQFTLEAEGASTKVTWAMRGSQPYLLKLMGIFVNTDKVLGKHFETGLANLKTATEGEVG